jgi:hypothetical protein
MGVEMVLEDKVAKALEAADSKVRGVFRVFAHETYANVVVCEHNCKRVSPSHIFDDLREAERVLEMADFEAWWLSGRAVYARAKV